MQRSSLDSLSDLHFATEPSLGASGDSRAPSRFSNLRPSSLTNSCRAGISATHDLLAFWVFFLFAWQGLFVSFPPSISRWLWIDEAIQSVEEIQSVILFFSLTCLTEQGKKG